MTGGVGYSSTIENTGVLGMEVVIGLKDFTE